MKLAQIVILALALIIGSQTAYAQKSLNRITWVKVEHDLGTIQKGIPTIYEFRFTNNNRESIEIYNVRASGGIIPFWDRGEIGVDKTGKIRLTFKPNRLGAFEKEIKVYLKGRKMPEILVIKGNIE